jgi:hypothetical protein
LPPHPHPLFEKSGAKTLTGNRAFARFPTFAALDEGQQMIKCPVCNKYDFEEDNNFDVCEVCGWENDGVQLDDPNYRGGANPDNLNERIAWWKTQQQLT